MPNNITFKQFLKYFTYYFKKKNNVPLVSKAEMEGASVINDLIFDNIKLYSRYLQKAEDLDLIKRNGKWINIDKLNKYFKNIGDDFVFDFAKKGSKYIKTSSIDYKHFLTNMGDAKPPKLYPKKQITKIMETIGKRDLEKELLRKDHELIEKIFKEINFPSGKIDDVIKKYPHFFNKKYPQAKKYLREYIRNNRLKTKLKLALKNGEFKSKGFAKSSKTMKALISSANQSIKNSTNYFQKIKIAQATDKIPTIRFLKKIKYKRVAKKVLRPLGKLGYVGKFLTTTFGAIVFDVLATNPEGMSGDELKFLYGKDMTYEKYIKMSETELNIRRENEIKNPTYKPEYKYLDVYKIQPTKETIDLNTSLKYSKQNIEMETTAPISTKADEEIKRYYTRQEIKRLKMKANNKKLFNKIVDIYDSLYNITHEETTGPGTVDQATKDKRTKAYSKAELLRRKISNKNLTQKEILDILQTEYKRSVKIYEKIYYAKFPEEKSVEKIPIEKTDEWNEKKAKESELNTLLLKKKQLTLQLLKSKLILQLLIKQKKLRAIQNG